jgi:predicted TIM-barrel fold metal-dependent hydrolase
MEPVIIISGDGHIGARPEDYSSYIDAEFRDALDDLITENNEFLALTASRPMVTQVVDINDDEFPGWNAERRLRDLDQDGVAAEVLHGGHQGSVLPFYSVMNKPYRVDLRAAGARAYHRWVADFVSAGDGRMLPIADPGPCVDLNDTVRELEWCAAHGFVSVSLVQNTWDDSLPPVHDRYYEPIWAACADLGLVLSVHAGWGSPQGKFWEFAKQFEKLVVGAGAADESEASVKLMEAMASSEDSPLKLDMGPRRALWQLMLGGVFDRHPDLTLVLTEVRADWLPSTLKLLDERFDGGGTPLQMRPSEYFARNCFVTPSSIHLCEVAMREEIGVDKMLFGTDYPHPEGTWPHTREWIRNAFHDVPEHELRAILGENAIRCYSLDRDKLAGVAAKIGPQPHELLTDPVVDPQLLETFQQRAGYTRPAEQADPDVVRDLLDEDLRLVGAAG